jgi:hypothetical protein
MGAKESHSCDPRWQEEVHNGFGNNLCGWELVRPRCDLRGKGCTSQQLGTRRRAWETLGFFHDKLFLCVLLPHSTHTLQPLDVVLFSPLSTEYSAELLWHLHRSKGLIPVKKSDFSPLFWASNTTSFTSTNILKAFEATGVNPRDAGVILRRFKAQHHNERETQKLGGTVIAIVGNRFIVCLTLLCQTRLELQQSGWALPCTLSRLNMKYFGRETRTYAPLLAPKRSTRRRASL